MKQPQPQSHYRTSPFRTACDQQHTSALLQPQSPLENISNNSSCDSTTRATLRPNNKRSFANKITSYSTISLVPKHPQQSISHAVKGIVFGRRLLYNVVASP